MESNFDIVCSTESIFVEGKYYIVIVNNAVSSINSFTVVYSFAFSFVEKDELVIFL